ncbi:MAG TPA: T9SS type A sorting domain-containing protein, partial [Candidatus Deferrimicrobium sp.]|nr:T9SS type A sorting domain-containing protein [Candidatus Deferrimicrobium sp.]
GNFSYCEVFSGSGSIVNGEWCFTPTGPGVYSTVIRCYDSCGAFCQGSFNVTVEENVKPELTCPSVIDTFLCAADSICYKVSVYDPDDGLTGVVSPVGVFDPLDTTVCFYADTAGTYVLTLIVSDTCGAKDTCTTTVNVTLNSPPVATCALNDTLFVCDLSAVCVPGFSCSDPDGNLTSCVVSPGTLSGGSVCFTPVEGDNTIMLVATDACGAADTCYTIIHVDLNGPPVANAGADQNVFQCVPTQICWPAGCSDPDSNLDSCKLVSGPGTFDGSQICFTPAGSGSYQFVLKAKDACGLTDFDTAVITVTINTAPVANCAPNDTLFRCNLSTICVKGFSCTDIDGNLVSCVASPGTLVGDSVCFIPVAGNNTITLIATDACGKKDTCQTIIRVVLNSAPVASCPPADTVLLCDLDTTLCVFGWWCTDPDGTPAQSGEYCFTPVAGINNLMNVCVDSCGAADTCQTFVFVIVNGPPEVTCPSDTTIKICNEIPDSVCIPGFDATDPNGNLATVTINGIPFDPGDLFCFTPDSGLNVLILEAEDACGLTAVCTTIVNILDTCLECPTFVIEKTHGTLQGTHEQVDVSVIDGSVPWGGFDILIAFDRSALNFQNVIPGDPYDQCGWEYITFRTWFWPSYEPHFFWAGIIRVFGLADLNNGPNHPSCFILPTPFVLFTIDFLVTDNLLFECQYVPIRFFWTTCNDNAVSSVTGDTLFVSDEIWEFDLGGEISDGTVGFPTYQGIQDSCLHGGGPGKPAPIPCIDFYNGGIDIICVDSIDDRGDINLNGVPNEIADAVLFTNYFIYGLSVFQVNPPGQIVATDVNADGLTLTVGDLVYLIRIIVGDAIAYSKLEAVSATYAVQNGVISVGGEMGAALVVVEGNATPTLLARQMELKYAYDAEANVTRVLVYSLQGHGFSGEFLNTGGSVIGVEFGSINGAVVEATTLPITYALNQNYPNPFNPVTTISFTLPTAGSYALSIYNVAGQQVAEFTGRSEPGTVAVDWDASEMASGVYFYRLEAGSFAATRKMLLLK